MKLTGRVLVVEDEPSLMQVVVTMLDRAGHEAVGVDNLGAAKGLLEQEDFDVVLSDLLLGAESGLDLLKWMREHRRTEPLIVMSAFGTVERAVQALKWGAFEFVEKPFDQRQLLSLLLKAVCFARARSQDTRIAGLDARLLLDSKNAEVRKISSFLSSLNSESPRSTPIVFWGEPGTGKDLIARACFEALQEREGHLYEWSAEDLTDEQIEEDLLGSPRRPGLMGLVQDGGVLLLHARSIPKDSGLRRALDSFPEARGRIVLTLGARSEISGAHEFRVPSLSERAEDFEHLARSVFSAVALSLGKNGARLTDSSIERLARLKWAGNLVELAKTFERALLSSDQNDLGPSQFAVLRAQGGDGSELTLKERVKARTQEFERQVILEMLIAESGNITRSSERLGLSRRGLQLKMKELGLERSDAWS